MDSDFLKPDDMVRFLLMETSSLLGRCNLYQIVITSWQEQLRQRLGMEILNLTHNDSLTFTIKTSLPVLSCKSTHTIRLSSSLSRLEAIFKPLDSGIQEVPLELSRNIIVEAPQMNEDASPLAIAAPTSIHPIHEPVEGSMIAPSLHIGSSLIEGQPQLILSQPQLIQTSNEYLHNKLGGYQG